MPFNRPTTRMIFSAIMLTSIYNSPLLAAQEPQLPKSPCNQPVPDLQHKAPGELTGMEEITSPNDNDFPKNARAWRIQYVSTGRDNNERTAVCGVVIAPKDPKNVVKPVGRVVAWNHGTLGTIPSCQPSFNPGEYIWKQTPYGIGAIGLGADQDKIKSENGILANMIDEGLIVSATDYYVDPSGQKSLLPYALGKIEAANIIDSVRASHQLLKQAYKDSAPLKAYDVVTWGHSQGGHASMWAGQLLPSYIEATAKQGDPAIKLAGVAIEAGPATLVAPARVLSSFSDLDWLAHAELSLTGSSTQVEAMPYFFSYLTKSWAQNSEAGPASASAMPAYPNTGALGLPALLTPEPLTKDAAGENMVDKVNHYCWDEAGLKEIIPLTSEYKTKPYLVKDVGDGPTVDKFQHGNLDRICAANPPKGIAEWCSWFTYNNLGPLGTSKLDKYPKRDGQFTPIYIAQGSHDEVVHCVAPESAVDQLPSAENCQSVTLYNALIPEYCPDLDGAKNKGYLELNIWNSEPGIEANHSNITGLAATASLDKNSKDYLSYKGSPLYRFITSAFNGTLKPGCSASVVNAPETAKK